MKRSTLGWIFGGVLAVGMGAFAWLWFAGGSGEPSTELTTPTIAGESTTTAGDETETTDAVADTGTEGASAFVIDQGQSQVRFELDEDLRGEPTRVVGTTDQVAGQVEVDLADLSTARMSDIVINARTLQTDSERRDRAIRGPVILNSAADEFEFIVFSNVSIDGLPSSASTGDTLQFFITGDLQIRGETNPVTFDASVSVVNDSTIEGTANTEVLRSDFGIGIPSVPGVANVTDEVQLIIDFTAVSG